MEIQEAVNKAIREDEPEADTRRYQLTRKIQKLIDKKGNERMILEVVNLSLPCVSCPIENGYIMHKQKMLAERIRKILNPEQ